LGRFLILTLQNVPYVFSSVIKKFCYVPVIVNVPDAVNLAILSPPG